MKETMIYRISYNKREDAYETYFYHGPKKNPSWDDFDWEMTCKCLPAWIEQEQRPTEEHSMIHYEILTHIRQALSLGYKIEFHSKPEERSEEK